MTNTPTDEGGIMSAKTHDPQTRAEVEDAIYNEHMAEQMDDYRVQSSPSPFAGS